MRLNIFYGVILFVVSISLVFAHSSGGVGGTKSRSAINIVEPQIDDSERHKEIHGDLIQEKFVNDFVLRFKVVDVKDSVPDGGSHNLLLNIKRDGRTQYKFSVKSTVDEMSGKRKSKTMMMLGDWYLAGYDFHQSEEYSITVSFNSPDGKIHNSTINYP